MKLLARSQSKRRIDQEEGSRQASVRDKVESTGVQRDQTVLLSHRKSRHLQRKALPSNQVQCNTVPIRRPQTADADLLANDPTRFSLFEPFELQAGDDVFNFPKPQSARTIPAEIAAMAAQRSPIDSSPKIGLAFGSPSHPPPGWQNFQHRQIDHPSVSRLGVVEHAHPEGSRGKVNDPQDLNGKSHPWKLFRNMFKKPSKSKSFRAAHAVPDGERRVLARSHTDPVQVQDAHRVTHVATESTDQSRAYGPSNARSTAKLQSILGLQTLSELWTPNLSTMTESPSPRSQTSLPLSPPLLSQSTPLQRHARPLPDLPRATEPKYRPDQTTLQDQNKPSLSSAPRLELALPSSQLDRYSVMFENVLESKTSIFERRRSRLNVASLVPNNMALQLDKPKMVSSHYLLSPQQIAERRASSPLLTPTIALWIHTSAAPTPLPKDTPLQRSPRTPRPSASPRPRPASLQTDLPTPGMRDGMTFFAEPSSDDEDYEDRVSPQTPHNDSPEHGKIKIFNDCSTQYTTATILATEHKLPPTDKWHAVVPAPPNSHPSPRDSLDLESVLDSPSVPMRSNSYHDTLRGRSEQTGRQSQVAVARSISFSRLQRGSERHGSAPGLRPKMIQVGVGSHSRKTSELESDDDTLPSTRYGMAL